MPSPLILGHMARQVGRKVSNKLSQFLKKLPQEARKGQRRKKDSPSGDSIQTFKPGRVMDRRLRSTIGESKAKSKRMRAASSISQKGGGKKTLNSILDSMIRKQKARK